MSDRLLIVGSLRIAALKGSNVCSLLEKIRTSVSPGAFNSFTAMSYLMEAFNLSLVQVRELSGAYYLGGQVYSDEKIEEMIYPLIKGAIDS